MESEKKMINKGQEQRIIASLSDIRILIKEARKAETCRDIELLKETLAPVWPDIESHPEIPELEPPEKGELLRLCGFFLGYYGHLNAKTDYQERGKDLLSMAIDEFESAGLDEEAAAAGLNLAWRYLQQGSHGEAEAILEYTKGKLGNLSSSPLSLRLKLFDCVTASAAGDFDRALKCVTSLRPSMEKCDDAGVRAQYHIEAAFICAETEHLPEALDHYTQAEAFAEVLGNERFQAIILGNIAYVLLKQRRYGRSLDQIEKAISLNRNRSQTGFLAHNFDTKAQGLLGLRDFGRALLAIDTSLELFRQGEDFAGHCDAIFNKVRILMKLGESEEALVLFAELIDLARTRIDESSARRYAVRFEELFFLPKARGYKEEVNEFRKFILREALSDANLVMKDAAIDLDISQAMLSDILRRQFPEIFDELGIKKRVSRKKKR